MSAENSFSIDFITRISKTDRSLAFIYARVTVNGDIKEISLHQPIPKEKWIPKEEVVKGRGDEVKAINEHIEKVRFRLRETYRKLQNEDKILTAQAVKDAYQSRNAVPKTGHTLIELIKYHDKIYRSVLAEGTMKNYVTMHSYISRFLQDQFNQQDIFLREVDYQFMTDLEYYIRNHPIKEWDPCTGNGVAKHLERVKKMVKWAKKLKWIKENLVAEYELHRTKSKRQKLNIIELFRIQNHSFIDPVLQYVRDLFIFACYTGLSYADVMKLSIKDLEIDNAGTLWITTYRQKSDELSPIPVLATARAIINKYKNDPRAIARGTFFRRITNQEVNRSLKIIGEVCEITKHMTFHLARHTFATAVTLKNGVPIETVSKMLGHTKLSTTQIYAEVDEEKLEKDMANVENRLFKQLKVIFEQRDPVKMRRPITQDPAIAI